jgi:hypothetical protein
VVLTNGDPDAYALEEAIEVTRDVRVMGNPAVLPTIDCAEAERCFTVTGGFFELSFVRTNQGGGIERERYGLEGLGLASTVGEIRGGAVSIEVGATGANFVGVVFTAIGTDPESIQGAIEDTLNFVGGRIYGGHVFVAAGNVNFFGCNFWDSALVLPLTDQVSLSSSQSAPLCFLLLGYGRSVAPACLPASLPRFDPPQSYNPPSHPSSRFSIPTPHR